MTIPKRFAEIENNGEMGVGIAFMGGQGTPATKIFFSEFAPFRKFDCR